MGNAGRNISAGLKLAIERGWLVLHDSGTFVRFTQAGADGSKSEQLLFDIIFGTPDERLFHARGPCCMKVFRCQTESF